MTGKMTESGGIVSAGYAPCGHCSGKGFDLVTVRDAEGSGKLGKREKRECLLCNGYGIMIREWSRADGEGGEDGVTLYRPMRRLIA